MAVFQMCQKSQLYRKAINNFMEPKGPMTHLCFTFFCWHNILLFHFYLIRLIFDNYIETISYI